MFPDIHEKIRQACLAFKAEVRDALGEGVEFLPRKDNGRRPDVESYWICYYGRRYARFDVYYATTLEQVRSLTDSYLDLVAKKNYPMCPFIAYTCIDKGPEVFLYRRNGKRRLSRVDIEHFASLIKSFYEQTVELSASVKKKAAAFVSGIHNIIDQSSIPSSKKDILKAIVCDDNLIFSPDAENVAFTAANEDNFFKCLICGDEQTTCSICRYTSLKALYDMLSSRKISMKGIACMNDASECSYVSEYLKLEGLLDEDPISGYNQYFILSCADISESDDLFMWNMYGDSSEGVCLEFDIEEQLLRKQGIDVQIERTCYEQERNLSCELDLLKSLLKYECEGKRLALHNLSSWQHFFKPYEYRKENEVRLLAKNDLNENTKWIFPSNGIAVPILEFSLNKEKNEDSLLIFPLKIKRIILGPNVLNAPDVTKQLYGLLQIHNSLGYECSVEPSKIKNYRK